MKLFLQDHKIMQIGYKEEEIRAFIPRKLRSLTMTEQAVIGDYQRVKEERLTDALRFKVVCNTRSRQCNRVNISNSKNKSTQLHLHLHNQEKGKNHSPFTI